MAQHDDRFWMVYGQGQRQPVVRHKTPASASDEAKRLARLNPGVRFYVLEPVSVSIKHDVETTDLRAKGGNVVTPRAISPGDLRSVHAALWDANGGNLLERRPLSPDEFDSLQQAWVQAVFDRFPSQLTDADIPF